MHTEHYKKKSQTIEFTIAQTNTNLKRIKLLYIKNIPEKNKQTNAT